MTKPMRRQSGISMLEVLITMFLVMVGLLVVMTSFVAVAKSHRYSERMDVAASLSRIEMERIRNLTYTNVQTESGSYSEYPDHPDYRHETQVTTLGSTKQVRLRMFFENDRRYAEMITYVTDM